MIVFMWLQHYCPSRILGGQCPTQIVPSLLHTCGCDGGGGEGRGGGQEGGQESRVSPSSNDNQTAHWLHPTLQPTSSINPKAHRANAKVKVKSLDNGFKYFLLDAYTKLLVMLLCMVQNGFAAPFWHDQKSAAFAFALGIARCKRTLKVLSHLAITKANQNKSMSFHSSHFSLSRETYKRNVHTAETSLKYCHIRFNTFPNVNEP